MDAVDFLWKDYELKVKYLSDHFSRMWTRFNFFLSIQSALLAVSLNEHSMKYAGYLGVAGLLLSILWYRFAAADNFLVEVYRSQVAHVFHLLKAPREAAFKAVELIPPPDGYTHAGYVSSEGFNPATKEIEAIRQDTWQRRWPRVSVTELGVVFAFVFGVVWIGRITLWWLEIRGVF